MQEIKSMSIHFDKYGLIVQANGDGGDSGARTGLYYFLVWILNKMEYDVRLLPHFMVTDFKEAIHNCSNYHGEFFRNPINYNDPKDFSRDQTNPLLVAMGVYEMYDILFDFWWGLIKRLGFYQNKDFAGPQDWGLVIRAMHIWPCYPFLIFSDLFLVLGSIIRCIKGRNSNDVGDDINHTMLLMQALFIYPTPISYVARKLYVKFRPGFVVKGQELLYANTINGVQYAWDWYFRPETGANAFNELARPVLRKYFS